MSPLSLILKKLKFGALSYWVQTSDFLSEHERKVDLPDKNTSLKVCLVKTTACRELYNLSSPCPIDQLVFSCGMRTGPIGLIQSLNADVHIVNTVLDYESQVFLRRENNNPISYKFRLENQAILAPFAVDVESIDWGKYDLVVAFENSVPSRIAKEYPDVTFVSMIEDHRAFDYHKYRYNLPEGYKLFFNLRTGPSPHELFKKTWEIDFTYGFREANALIKLLPQVQKNDTILVENHENPEICAALEKLTGMRAFQYSGNSVIEFYKILRSARFFVSLQPSRPLGGLAAIDAISAGTIVIANRYRVWNPHPICKELHVNDVYGAAKIINQLNSNSESYDDMLSKQSRLLQYYCYNRPLSQILNFLK